MSKKDHLSNEVSLGVTLSEKGISGKAKLRTIAAFDRLLGSLIDIPTAILEAFANKIRAKSEQEIKLMVSEVPPPEYLPGNDYRLAQVITENHLPRQIEYISNKLKIVEHAIEHLSEGNSHEASQSTNEEIDDDWFNYFEQYAEKASSERMQDLWARVLAGEIRKPTSFSLTTLRFLSELDKKIASLFEQEVKYRTHDGYILMPGKDKLRGQRLLDLAFLEEVGLLLNVATGFGLTRKPNSEGIVGWKEGNFLLRAETKREIKLSLIPLTRIGREIASILPPTEPLEVLERVGKQIYDQVDFLEIHSIIYTENNIDYSRSIKIIKNR